MGFTNQYKNILMRYLHLADDNAVLAAAMDGRDSGLHGRDERHSHRYHLLSEASIITPYRVY